MISLSNLPNWSDLSPAHGYLRPTEELQDSDKYDFFHRKFLWYSLRPCNAKYKFSTMQLMNIVLKQVSVKK